MISDSNRDGWWEAVVEIALDPAGGCSCASFRVHFDKPVSEFVLDIGDSPTNNGYGGDAGTTFHEAETMILREKLEVYTASRKPGLATVDKLLSVDLPPLAGHFLDLEVCDQTLSVSLPNSATGKALSWKLNTRVSGLLYDLHPQESPEGHPAPKRRDAGIFASFNRVIHDKSGTPNPADRTGTGVKAVEIRLSP